MSTQQPAKKTKPTPPAQDPAPKQRTPTGYEIPRAQAGGRSRALEKAANKSD